MAASIDRRTFLQSVTAAGLVAGSTTRAAAQGSRSAGDRIVVAVMGTHGRGAQLARVFAGAEGCEVGAICDVDARAIDKGIKAVAGRQSHVPTGHTDFRRALEDRDIDALVVAAPDHWHAPAALLALSAGKHVYLEKPGSHNPRECELVAEAAAHHGRLVQLGTQRRSWPGTNELIDRLRDGVIGRVYFAKGWYVNTRASIGHGQPADVPSWLDYELWQGPAPRRPFRDNLVHYNWHWFWHWGTGEACNNGTHEVDVMRWGLGVDYPTRVVSAGGRYHFRDDWETPDTQVISWDFPSGCTITWEGRSCNGRPIEGQARGVTFHGEGGSVLVDDDAYTILDKKNAVVATGGGTSEQSTIDTTGPGDRLDAYHIVNFLESIRGRATATAPIAESHKSVLLCHLGNVAHRTGRALTCSPETGRVQGDDQATAFWSREYERGWEPRV